MKSHRNCTVILRSKPRPDARFKWAREQTHGCWCSAWQEQPDGTWKVWRNGRWTKPAKGELRNVKNPERFEP